MKLDLSAFKYLSKDDFRVLTAVEMGMKNHEIVPEQLINRIASLKHGGTDKVLRNLLKHKTVHHETYKNGHVYRLTKLGYDFLAINALVKRGVFHKFGRKIGGGKESEIYEVETEDEKTLVLKVHKLGRVSFRAVKHKRDYLLHRNSYNWLYVSRLSACKEFAFMKELEKHGFPVPQAVDCNRHCVVMSVVDGCQLAQLQVKQLQNPKRVFETIVGLIVRMAKYGLIHCDFNEFNIMIGDKEEVTMIDFPQMVSVSHENAKMYFDRDIYCIYKFFSKSLHLCMQEVEDNQLDNSEVDACDSGRSCFSSISKEAGVLDKELLASGFLKNDQADIQKWNETSLHNDFGDKDDYVDFDSSQSFLVNGKVSILEVVPEKPHL
ncbi:unnamed protein product [Victoria cruziana]